MPVTPWTARAAVTLAATAVGIVVTAAVPGSAVAVRQDTAATVRGAGLSDVVPGDYIVVMRPGAPEDAPGAAKAAARSAGGRVRFSYDAALPGFAATLPARALEAVARNPHVQYIEADQRIGVTDTQGSPTWGLDRIDQRTLPLDRGYTYPGTGAGVTAYIIDTGILGTHAEFGSRVAAGYSAVADGLGTTDCNGHGTHVAGTVGGTTYGVAKGVTLRPVRVLGCDGSGTTSGVIAGVDWVTANRAGPSVANMSLGGVASSALDTAVQRSIDSGVAYAVAAGNEATDACAGSPARLPGALTVGSTTSSDARSSFSNFGPCLDLFAPGTGITSAWYTSDSATSVISGTSMAAPHVAGAAAIYLGSHPTATPATVADTVVALATGNAVTGAGAGSPNRLLFSPTDGTTPPAATTNLFGNPGFEAGATRWSGSSGVITRSSLQPARTGTWKAWLNGYGTASTETLSQSVTVPSSAASAVLSFWSRIQTAETTSLTRYDRLRVQVVAGGVVSTLATYSNLNAASTWTHRRFNLGAYRGKTVRVRFIGTENASRATSFVLDDTALTVG